MYAVVRDPDSHRGSLYMQLVEFKHVTKLPDFYGGNLSLQFLVLKKETVSKAIKEAFNALNIRSLPT